LDWTAAVRLAASCPKPCPAGTRSPPSSGILPNPSRHSAVIFMSHLQSPVTRLFAKLERRHVQRVAIGPASRPD